MMLKLFITPFLILGVHVLGAQNFPKDCPDCPCVLTQAEKMVTNSRFDQAIRLFNAYKVCAPGATAKIDQRILDVFDLIDRQRLEAIAARKEADRQKQIAISAKNEAEEAFLKVEEALQKIKFEQQQKEAALEKAESLRILAEQEKDRANEILQKVTAEQEKNQRILSQFYFYADQFALAYNNNKYGFINKEGNVMIPFDYDEASPFDDSGLAKVVKAGTNYYIDTLGFEYTQAFDTEELDESTIELNLKSSRLSDIPGLVFEHPQLKFIDFSNNRINKLNPKISNLKALIKLDLSNNNLDVLTAEIGFFSALVNLNLHHNQLVKISPAIGQLKKLTTLDCSQNSLKTLPETLQNLSALQSFDLSQNKLERIPPSIGRLQQLTTINLAKNRLTTLDPAIGNLLALEYLNLSDNRLVSIPETINGLTNLTTLDLRNNKLEQLPKAIIELTSLAHLDLRGNRFDENELSALTEQMSWCYIIWQEAKWHFDNGRYKEAFQTISYDVLREPNKFNNQFLYGYYALFVNRPIVSILASKIALNLNPTYKGTYSNLALGYLLNDQWEEAEKIYNQYIGLIFSESFNGQKLYWDQVFMDDIEAMEGAGISHPDFEKAKKLIKK